MIRGTWFVGDASPSGNLTRADPVECRPSQAIQGSTLRAVLTSDPAVVAKFIEELEQVRIVDLTHAGFVPSRHAGDLQVSQQADAFAQRVGQVSLQQLHVVGIQMQEQVVASDLSDDAPRVL